MSRPGPAARQRIVILVQTASASLATTLVSTAFNWGIQSGFPLRWLQTFAVAYPFAAAIGLIVAPRLQRWTRPERG